MNNNEHEYFPQMRRQEILEFIRKNKTVSVHEISRNLFINEATIRRDLNSLQSTGLIRRTYGGAVLSENPDSELPLFIRDTENHDKKECIGQKASTYVRDGETIFIDSSSTVMRMIPFLEGKKNLKIVTNGLKTSFLLLKLHECKVYCAGGLLSESSQSFTGSDALDYLKNFYVDKAFFSCRGISCENGFTNNNEQEAKLRKVMVKQCRQSFALIDSTKFNVVSFFCICALDAVNNIISNTEVPQAYLSKLKPL